MLVGITSWNSDCAVREKPTVFTRVASLVDWVRKYTNGMYAARFTEHLLVWSNVKILIIEAFSFGFF